MTIPLVAEPGVLRGMLSSATATSKPAVREKVAERAETTKRVPNHLAIILDGNGRWATRQGRARLAGHLKGVEAVRSLVDACVVRGIPHLSLYAFSVQNWSRPAEEVQGLMRLLCEYLDMEAPRLAEEGVRLRLIGNRAGLPGEVQTALDAAEKKTAKGTRMQVNLAINYGGKEELVHAVKALAELAVNGEIEAGQIDESKLEQQLYTQGLPPVDLLIRTAGERRLSNFLLWHAAYAELLFMDVLWPDFAEMHLDQALADFSGRKRTFGGLVDKA